MNLHDKNNEPVRVTDNPGLLRYEIHYPGADGAADAITAGFVEYLDSDGERIFFHTEVPEEFGGRGLASVLIGEALRDTAPLQLQIVPVCPFVKAYVEKNSVAGARPATAADMEKIRHRY